MQNDTTQQDFDIIIAGGGMIGASMALAAANDGFKVAVVEAVPLSSDAQQSFDERTVALTYSSYVIFQHLGVWPDVNAHACPIHTIDVTDQNHWGYTRLDRHDAGTEALGYVVATRSIGAALYDKLSGHKNVRIFCPAKATDCQATEKQVNVEIQRSGESADNTADQPLPAQLTAKCLVVADGGRSELMSRLNLERDVKTYDSKALTGIVSGDRPHGNIAFEHFMQDGPLALLPYRETDYALVWTAAEKEQQMLNALDDTQLLKKISKVFAGRIGELKKIGRRQWYPLSYGKLQSPVENRVVVIGNAAHIVHPVAGQGFNLGLRDVAALADVFMQHKSDPGDKTALDNYCLQRQHDTKMVGILTDGLIRTFSSDALPVAALRNAGLSAINLLPPVKKALLHRTMGIHQSGGFISRQKQDKPRLLKMLK